MIRHTFLGLMLLLTAVTTTAAGDWPEFRGPTGQGIASGQFSTSWGPDKGIAWKQEVPGQGWSSPAVRDGRVFLTTAASVSGSMSGDLSLRTLAFDAATGKLLWDREVFRQEGAKAPAIHSKNSHASPTPLAYDGRLYVHFGHQGTACLDVRDGKVLWSNRELGYKPVHGNGGSPVLVDDLLVFSADGADNPFVAALDRATGKLRWRTPRGGDAPKKFSFSTPLVIEVAGQKQLVSPASNAVVAYEPATGKELWRVRYEGYSVVPRPVFGHGLVFLSTGYDSPKVLAIRPDGQGDVTDTHVAWSTRKNAPHAPSLLLDGDDLFMISDGGVASLLDARTGKVHWQERVGGAYSASPLLADNKIYVTSEEGITTVLKSGRTYERLARNPLDERTLASLAAADGALFLRTARHLYRIGDR